MKQEIFEKDTFIIKENDVGEALFVVEEGQVNILKGNKILNLTPLSTGTLFGELALLYNCTRSASVLAVTNIKVWSLDRYSFKVIMQKNIRHKRDEINSFLITVDIVKQLSPESLSKVIDAVEEVYINLYKLKFFAKDSWIVQQNDVGSTFFIIVSGEVVICKYDTTSQQQKEIRTLSIGDYFGEKALLGENSIRTASVRAKTDVRCYVLQREIFVSLVGNLAERDYQDEEQLLKFGSKDDVNNLSMNIKLNEDIRIESLTLVATLGRGGFGQVDLGHPINSPTSLYALKTMSKKYIVKTRQEQHILDEKRILEKIHSPFIVRLFKTFKDNYTVNLLLEACLGGEIYHLMHIYGKFSIQQSSFAVGCVVEAFDYLHKHQIIYRDLKPENMVMDSIGYVDFGFAKILRPGEKTWTFCGTPEYVAPEIITSKGHDRAADYWSLGILIHELLHGSPPFKGGNDTLMTYKLILKGIDAVKFPKGFPKQANDLVRKLCKEKPAERLGYQKAGVTSIKKHKFFDNIDWEQLKNQKFQSPFTPKVPPLETFITSKRTKFIPHPEYEEEISGWDEEF